MSQPCYIDLFGRRGRNVLYRNQGDGTFRDETEARDILTAKPRWSTGWHSSTLIGTYLDLVVVHYVDLTSPYAAARR